MLSQELIANLQKLGHASTGMDRTVIGVPCIKIPKNKEGYAAMGDSELKFRLWKRDNYFELQNYISKVLMDEFKVKRIPTKYGYRYCLYSEIFSQGKLLCMIHIGVAFGSPYINFEFNPSKLNEDDIKELRLLLSYLLFNHYEELYQHGVVSHCEFYVDIHGVTVSDLVLIDTGRRRAKQFESSAYYGPRCAPLVGTLYDRTDRLKKNGGKVNAVLTRFEARIEDRNLKFSALIAGQISNPLSPFFIVPANALKKIEAECKSPYLATKIAKYGVYQTTKGNPHARQALINRLRADTVDWWDADLYWESHKEMMQEFVPEFLGGGESELVIY